MDVTQKLKNRSKGVRNCKASEQLFHFNSTKEITAPDYILYQINIILSNRKEVKKVCDFSCFRQTS
jgi:hypothetical protein